MILITMSGLGYAAWNDNITTVVNLSSATYDLEITEWHVEKTNSYDANGNGIILGDELIIENVLGDGQVVGLQIEANPIFPSWELLMVIKIHNTAESWVTDLNYKIYYSEDGTTWVETTAEDLKTLFGIIYTDGFYLGPGPDEKWGTIDDEPVTFPIDPCNSVYKLEHILFDAQERTDLQGKIFYVMVEVTATYPQT